MLHAFVLWGAFLCHSLVQHNFIGASLFLIKFIKILSFIFLTAINKHYYREAPLAMQWRGAGGEVYRKTVPG